MGRTAVRLTILSIFAFAVAACSSRARTSGGVTELEGVRFATTAEVAGRPLKLNGVGLRQVLMFKPYVVGLWLEHPAGSAQRILADDGARRLELAILADLTRDQVRGAFRRAVDRSLGEAAERVRPKLDPFFDALRDLHKGERVIFSYLPGDGLTIEGGTTTGHLHLDGKEASDAVFSIWLGAVPVDAYVRKGLLGQ